MNATYIFCVCTIFVMVGSENIHLREDYFFCYNFGEYQLRFPTEITQLLGIYYRFILNLKFY